MKIINLQFSINDLKGFPGELILFIGKASKSNEKTYIYIQSNNNSYNEWAYKVAINLLSFYKIENVSIVKESVTASEKIILPIKLNMFFYPNASKNNVKQNVFLKAFIREYEKLLGKLPY